MLEQAYDIAVDASGGVFVTGQFSDTAAMYPSDSSLSLTSVGRSDVFVLKLDSNGDFLWGQRFGGADHDLGYGVAGGGDGGVVVTGNFYSETVNTGLAGSDGMLGGAAS